MIALQARTGRHGFTPRREGGSQAVGLLQFKAAGGGGQGNSVESGADSIKSRQGRPRGTGLLHEGGAYQASTLREASAVCSSGGGASAPPDAGRSRGASNRA